jgi:SanA protein
MDPPTRSRLPVKRSRLLLLLGGAASLSALGVIHFSARRIERSTAPALVPELAALPHKPVGLVLGCAPLLSSGRPNWYFEKRIEAAASVFAAGKVDYLLVSGDNHRVGYDEPTAMKDALVKRGVPADRIVLDHAGFSTLDSVVRAQKVFGLSEFCVITQGDHARRALYIAQTKGIAAVAYPAGDVSARQGLRTRLREALARVRTLLDLHMLGRKPRFLGPKIEIGQAG